MIEISPLFARLWFFIFRVVFSIYILLFLITHLPLVSCCTQVLFGVFSFCFLRVLIAYENGLIVLWDITEDRAALVREYKQHQSKDEIVVYALKNAKEEKFRASSDNQEGEKEISSLCWLSSDGSILAVGYIDGDILLWNISVPGKKSPEAEASSNYVKLQLSAGAKRLPVIILRWSAKNTQNGCGGKLFVYGGDSIGSEEALTVSSNPNPNLISHLNLFLSPS